MSQLSFPSWLTRTVQGSSSKPYSIERQQYYGCVYYTCTCDNFFWGSADEHLRTCKHIRQVIGDALDTQRLNQDFGKTLPVERASFALCVNLDNTDPSGWVMSEKLNGCRAMFDGSNFYTRSGNMIVCPSLKLEYFKSFVPSGIVLDGELWTSFGRDSHHVVGGLVQRKNLTSDTVELWDDVHFTVFDIPSADGTFWQRWDTLPRFIEIEDPADTLDGEIRIHAVPQERCQGRQHLNDRLMEVAAHGGEGIVLRHPDSKYTMGRSKYLRRALCPDRDGTP
ncbi:hypothetical protein CF327_g733 [Tilletia walkeri]|nr:hypothetical protein CF327_g733 [Tilletia walkeri]